MRKQRHIAVSTMLIDGVPVNPGDVVTIDPADLRLRGWIRAGNVRPVTKKASKGK